MKMIKSLKIIIPITFLIGLTFGQSVQGNFDATTALVEYTYVTRDSSASAEDVDYHFSTSISWPSSAQPQATLETRTFEPGDTIRVVLQPLVTPALLQAVGVAVNVDFNDAGTFIINDGSTYPTTGEANCSTYTTIPAVAENGTWTKTPGFNGTLSDPTAPLKHTMGWGISFSEVFAQFNAADLVGGTAGVDYGPGTAMPNWGMIEVTYSDSTHTTPTHLETYWEAHDGEASGLGIDANNEFNGYLGVPIAPADTVTIPNMDDLLYATNPDLWENLGWTGEAVDYPMINGQGNIIDPSDPSTFSVSPITGDTSATGTIGANKVYYFDPTGDDGVPFNGDEALAPTGYFMTYNFLEARGMFSAVFSGQLSATNDIQGSARAAADSVAFIYLDEADSDDIADMVSAQLSTAFTSCLTNGGTQDACLEIMEQGPTAVLNAVQDTCNAYEDYCDVDDSGWNYDPVEETGRLIFEVDNRCIRDLTTQRVRVTWVNTQFVQVDEAAPVASEFKIFGNYPNPFNPSTKIKFSTEKISDIKLNVYSLLGERVYQADMGLLGSGTYDISWHGIDNAGAKVSSGIYFYEVQSDNRILRGKMLLMK
tara:strand:- start:105570 stop:107354 length:1785 start_codon:yes stop_codon:yes gene_type:complete